MCRVNECTLRINAVLNTMFSNIDKILSARKHRIYMDSKQLNL
jgi:hypothetical protein